MKLFPSEPSINLYETAFDTDDYGRRGLAEQLTQKLDEIEGSTVFALDDHWGTGKTVFLKKWAGHHSQKSSKNAKAIYFDAFKHDFQTDPLISLIAAIGNRFTETSHESKVKKIKEAAIKLRRPAFNLMLNLATLGAKQQFDEVGDVISDITSSTIDEAATALWETEGARANLVEDFKRQLSELAATAPLVIVVDELDRCRPDFALSVLEVVKHFFSVENVHFILGINGDAMANSVRARYGASIDGEKYLRKFINVTFGLPRVLNKHSQAKILDRYARDMVRVMNLRNDLSEACIDLSVALETKHQLGFRDVNKILSTIASATSMDNLPDGRFKTLVVLVVSSAIAPEFHKNLLAGKATFDEMLDFFGLSFDELLLLKAKPAHPAHHTIMWDGLLPLLYCMDLQETIQQLGLTGEFDRWFGHSGRSVDTKTIPRDLQRDVLDTFKI